MATNVFGTPVIEGDRSERALKALNDRNAGGKRDEAVAYVRKLKFDWGNGVSLLAVFYNATGETMTYMQDNAAYGHIYDSFPVRVQNGQWGAFFHVKATAAASGTNGFVVYRVRVDDTDVCNQLIGWSVPWDQVRYDNQAYCDIFDDGKVDSSDEVYNKMEANNHRQHVAIKKGMITTTTIELGTSPLYEAEFSRDDVAVVKFYANEQNVEASSAT